MKTIVLGDIHGRDCWKEIIKKEEPGRVVFLGDYVSSHERDMTPQKQISNLIEILDWKEEMDLTGECEVILLRGNHDVQMLQRDSFISGYDPVVGNWFGKPDNRERFMKNTKWVWEDENKIIYSHAGISETWMKRCEFESLDEINECNQLIYFQFTPCKMSDYYGDSATQPLTWIRPSSLLSYGLRDRTFVVGHTAYKFGIADMYEKTRELFPQVFENIKDRNVHIWLCDALPRQYLIVNDGEFEVASL